jgi:choline dehydrogenase-like flavoprotein
MSLEKHLPSLAALCDVFVPALHVQDDRDGYYARTAADQGVPARILSLLPLLKAEDRTQLEQLLQLINSPILGLTWWGPLKAAHKLDADQRERLLRRWAASPLAPIRNAYNTLRKLTTMLYYGDVPDGRADNPNWPTIGYEPVREYIKPEANPLPMWQPDRDQTVDCDVLVIGSGSGGSIVAAVLAAAGQSVVVLDKGPYAPIHEFNQQEFPMLRRHFEASSLLTSKSGSITVLAGSTVGGGTTINWAGSLRTPDYVLEEWASQHGNPHFVDASYQRCFEHVEKRNGVSTAFAHDPQNQALYNAAKQLKYKVENIPMNMRFPDTMPEEAAWAASGFSCYGDAYGIKQGAVQTFLRDAVQHGARIVPDTAVQRLNIANGEATGAIAQTRTVDGRTVNLTFRAKRVVVSAGTLHTPVLLMKSGLSHPQLGRNLFLHPVVNTAAFYPYETKPWFGPMMSVIVQEFTRQHENWGARIECPPLHPGLAAFALGWDGGTTFKQDMANLRHSAAHICLGRDRYGGRVTVGKQSGQPVIHYDLHDYDRKHLIKAAQESVRLHYEAGAERITFIHNQPLQFYRDKKDNIDTFIANIAQQKWGSNWLTLFSAHQMGTCRMGGTKDYPVDPSGAFRGVRNLWVADASLFPAASGTNPMLSVQALAYYVAQQIKV